MVVCVFLHVIMVQPTMQIFRDSLGSLLSMDDLIIEMIKVGLDLGILG